MDKEYFARSTIHHGVPTPNSLGARRSIVIPGGAFFDPRELGLDELTVADMLTRGIILTREGWTAHEVRMREARVLVDRSNVVVRSYQQRAPSMDSMLLSGAELDRILR